MQNQSEQKGGEPKIWGSPIFLSGQQMNSLSPYLNQYGSLNPLLPRVITPQFPQIPLYQSPQFTPPFSRQNIIEESFNNLGINVTISGLPNDVETAKNFMLIGSRNVSNNLQNGGDLLNKYGIAPRNKF